MTPSLLIEHVETSIAKALRHESFIDESILGLKGFSTGVMRRLFSNLAHLPKSDPIYLECGLYAGGTFCAAMNNNPRLKAIGVEDYSQDFGDHTIRRQLTDNFARYSLGTREAHLVYQDCFTIDLIENGNLEDGESVDMYFFDGEHSFESQAKALPAFIDVLSDVFLFIVDDASWVPVRDGTAAGFEELRDRVVVEKKFELRGEQPHDDPIWHNGVDIYVCSHNDA
jgi:hypothetical protein